MQGSHLAEKLDEDIKVCRRFFVERLHFNAKPRYFGLYLSAKAAALFL